MNRLGSVTVPADFASAAGTALVNGNQCVLTDINFIITN